MADSQKTSFRPKRMINKPIRYVTTSSSEEASTMKHQRMAKTFDVDDDINDLRRMVQEDERCNDAPMELQPQTNSQPQTQSGPEHTYFMPQTHSELHTHSQPQTLSEVHTHSLPQMHSLQQTHSQLHTHSQPQMQSQRHTHSQLQMHSQLHTHSQPQMHSQQHTHSQLHTHSHSQMHSQQHMHSQLQMHAQRQTLSQHENNLNSYTDSQLRMGPDADMHSVLTQLQKMANHSFLVQDKKKQKRSTLTKPTTIPIKSVEDLEAFEEIEDDKYNDVVQYLKNVGGFNAKEAITLCLKESFADSASTLFTWRGRKGLKPLYNARAVLAIFDAVCWNSYFPRPTRQEFQQHIREALRAAKERVRSKTRRRHPSAEKENENRDLWSDDLAEEEEVTD